MLTEIQELLTDGLKMCNVSTDTIIAIVLMLETTEQQLKMAEYLRKTVENPPEETEIFTKAVEIAEQIPI